MKFYVSTPSTDWSICGAYWATMDGLELFCREKQVSLYKKPMFGTSDLVWARNYAVHDFLKTDATHLFTFDSDQGCNANLFFKLAESPYQISACPVPKKRDGLDPAEAFNFVCENTDDPLIEGNFARVEVVGAGFMCIKREFIIRMCYEAKCFWSAGEPLPDLYENLYTETSRIFPEKLSEDYSFCLRAGRLGEKPWIYWPAQVIHMGAKIWKGNLSCPASSSASPQALSASTLNAQRSLTG